VPGNGAGLFSNEKQKKSKQKKNTSKRKKGKLPEKKKQEIT